MACGTKKPKKMAKGGMAECMMPTKSKAPGKAKGGFAAIMAKKGRNMAKKDAC